MVGCLNGEGAQPLPSTKTLQNETVFILNVFTGGYIFYSERSSAQDRLYIEYKNIPARKFKLPKSSEVFIF